MPIRSKDVYHKALLLLAKRYAEGALEEIGLPIMEPASQNNKSEIAVKLNILERRAQSAVTRHM